jgi:hypothetical protein
MRHGFALSVAAAMAIGLGGAVGIVRGLEGATGPSPAQEEVRFLPSPAVARRLAFGYEPLAADLMWIRTVQYFGKHLGGDDRFPRLRPLLEVAVGLDPHFIEAYRDGAVFLWIAGDIPGTVSLLEEGYRQNPGRWEMPHDLGRLYFLQLGDSAQALRWWSITERLPDAPMYLPRFIARLQGKVGNVETAIELWEAIENDPDTHEHFRTIAQQEVKRLRAQLARERRSP